MFCQKRVSELRPGDRIALHPASSATIRSLKTIGHNVDVEIDGGRTYTGFEIDGNVLVDADLGDPICEEQYQSERASENAARRERHAHVRYLSDTPIGLPCKPVMSEEAD